MTHLATTGTRNTDPLDDMLGRLERPHCYKSFGHFFAHSNSANGECGACASNVACSSALAKDVVAAEKWQCFGAGVHKVNHGRHCDLSVCGMAAVCGSAKEALSALGEEALISKARKAAKDHRECEDASVLPAPPVAPVGSEIIVRATSIVLPASSCAISSTLVSPGVIVLGSSPITESGRSPSFPFDEEKYFHHKGVFGHQPDSALIAAVRSLSDGVHPDGSVEHGYSELREMFLAASMLLNERGTIGPRFRSRKGLEHHVSAADQTYACDLQLIDLHWLSCHGEPMPIPEFEDIFLSSEMSFARAWEFACRKTRASYKAKLLGLGGVEEHCLSVIQREDVQTAWKRLHEQRDRPVRQIKCALAAPKSRRSDSVGYLYDVFRALRVMDGDRAGARALIAFMGHAAPGKTDFDRQAKWLEKIGLSLKTSAEHA